MKHNEANRQTRESRQRSNMLHKGRENYFRYDVEDLLRAHELPEERVLPIAQTLLSKGSRLGINEARDYVREKAAEGIYGPEVEKKLLALINQYSVYR
ncbi:MAG: hypothetical protein KY455_02710 [Euryarchaeota archaeon]|nr:hypothetical protein [Euryarchaeota archaeon]